MSHDDRPTEPPQLVVVSGYEGVHLVSPTTLRRAEEEADRADRAANCDDFGELRRSGDIDQLAEQLHRYGVSIDDYLGAIEVCAPSGSERPSSIAERLATVESVEFDGDEEIGAPSDDERLIESDDDVEDVYADVIARGMANDVPAAILDRFGLLHHLMFQSEPVAFVPPDQLDEVVEALTAAGYQVLEEDEA